MDAKMSQTSRAWMGLVVSATGEDQKPADLAGAKLRCGSSDKESTTCAAPLGHAPSSTSFDGEAVSGRCDEL